MKRVKWLIVALFTGLLAMGGELVIAERGKESPYSIVLSEGVDVNLEQFVRLAGETIARAVEDTCGVKLPVVRESEYKGGRALFIGPVKRLHQVPGIVRVDSFKLWEHRIFAKDGDLFIVGCDRSYLTNPKRFKDYTMYVLGTLKAALEFCERYCHTAFPYPKMMTSLPSDQVTVPGDCAFVAVPRVLFCNGRAQEVLYDIANNFFPAPWYGTYGGHSHDRAIPASMYKEHPEYFAVLNGKRGEPHQTRPQHCLSNPDVQRLIYQELLTHVDKGYEMVQLNQSDGFRACECEKCAKMYGVESFGEKLWLMHRDMALRFLEERPGKTLCIMAYGPTRTPPQTFREFPPNVVVDLAPCNAEVLASWSGIKVPGGFTAYLYNWGYYQLEGFTPKRSADFLSSQLKLFAANNIKGIYRCGFGELFGLEGPAYFQFGKQLAEPTLAPAALVERYCAHTYGKAAQTMRKFFASLDECLQKDSDRQLDWNDASLLEGGQPSLGANMRLLMLRYPPEVLARLESALAEGERLEPDSWPLKVARLEFDYLKLTVNTIVTFDKYSITKQADDGNAMLHAIVRRNVFIDALPHTKSDERRVTSQNGVRLFGGATLREVRENGRLSAPLRDLPVQDVAWMLANHILPLGRVVKPGDAPQLLVQQDFYAQYPQIAQQPISFIVAAADDALRVTLLFPTLAQNEIHNDPFQVFYEYNGRRLRFAGRCRNGNCALYERTVANADNKGMGDQYQRAKPSVAGKITAPAPDTNSTSVLFEIPWDIIGGKPAPGETRAFNVCCEHDKIRRIWEHNARQKTWRNTSDAIGTLSF